MIGGKQAGNVSQTPNRPIFGDVAPMNRGFGSKILLTGVN